MELSAQLVSFPSGDLDLRGLLYRADDGRRARAVIWNHGSERVPGSGAGLARFYAERGYALFLPHRHGHGQSPGDYPTARLYAELREETEDGAVDRRRLVTAIIEQHERYLGDTLAAVSWLRRQPFIDHTRIVMSGVSHGGVQTLLAAEADAGMQAYIPFAPAAMAWDGNPELQDRLVRAVRGASAPIFLLQAENDHSLGPSEVLGEELGRKGEPNRARVYPAYGDSPESGHGDFACDATDVWGEDVWAFLDQAAPAPSRRDATPDSGYV